MSPPEPSAPGHARRAQKLAWKMAALACAACPLTASADMLTTITPSSAFVQAGVAEDASALVAGLTWDWGWRKPIGPFVATGYWEVSFGRWTSHYGDRRSTNWVTQIGITPVLRLHGRGAPDAGWYGELGIGANVLLPIYRSEDKQFSTEFNFGDHLAVGRTFGERGRHDIALRVQHFSNAGIRKPNPGEDFVQLRYSAHF